MSDTFKYLNKTQTKEDPAQDFLKTYTDRYTPEQQARLDANGGPSVASSSAGVAPDSKPTSSPVVGGGTERYADYTNSNNGETAFTDTWQDGAKYQQLRGSGVLTNKDFDAQFASSKGGADTGTVADDGGGWKLIKTDAGEKTNERKLEYKDVASQWQAAGYDVRVQDHNPDFEGGTGEIAVRVGSSKSTEPEGTPIEYSPEIQQAKERVANYENDIMSGKTTDDIYSNSYEDGDYSFDATKGAAGIGTPLNGDSGNRADEAVNSFLENKRQDVKQQYQFKAQ